MRILVIIFIFYSLTSCGTAKGVLYGTGTVLEGVATDVRTVATGSDKNLAFLVIQTSREIF